jgi:2-dehydro-3-deoxyphosphogluconate aldolase / (4S)-4-hydroxy-2-oxoglutarate aldolase
LSHITTAKTLEEFKEESSLGFYDWMKEHRLVAIVRGIDRSNIIHTAEALYTGGLRLLEVTLNTPEAPQMISELRASFNGELLIGAGTVLNKKMAEEAYSAGAQYFITPNLNEEVIHYGLERGIDVLPGVMTPTEIVKAYNAGAGMVKVFPTGSLGSNYLKELQGPLGHIPMVAVGEVTLENLKSFFQAGAVGIGVGSSLINKEAVRQGNYEVLTMLAGAYIGTIKGCDSDVYI